MRHRARFVMDGSSRHGHPDDRLDDTAAMARAYDAHAGELYGFALRALDDRSTAEEAVQETFVRACRAASRFDPTIGGVRTWLFAICRNVVVDLSRSRASRANRDEMLVPNPSHDELDRRLRAWQVEEAVGRLSDHHRQVVVAIYYGGSQRRRSPPRWASPRGRYAAACSMGSRRCD